MIKMDLLTKYESEPHFQDVLHGVMEELIDLVSLGLCFDVHQQCCMDTLYLLEGDPRTEEEFYIVDKPGFDVLGQPLNTKPSFECECPNCHRHVAASRFAPHLEKCMGMGRNSYRLASRRIATSTKRDSDDSGGEDLDEGEDWTFERKKAKKAKKEKGVNSPRNKKGKMRNGACGSSSHGALSSGLPSSQESVDSVSEMVPVPNYDSMTFDDRKTLLMNNCGVISEHTKKMCTRSVRCPQHSDEQRRHVRYLLLRQNRPIPEVEDVHIDIDTCDDAETQSLRESLQWEASSVSSPPDSTSTNNSTSSHRRTVKTFKITGSSKAKILKASKTSSSSSSSSKDSSFTNLFDFLNS